MTEDERKQVRTETIREVAQHVELALYMGTPVTAIPRIILDIF